jgi:hypothetical protein
LHPPGVSVKRNVEYESAGEFSPEPLKVVRWGQGLPGGETTNWLPDTMNTSMKTIKTLFGIHMTSLLLCPRTLWLLSFACLSFLLPGCVGSTVRPFSYSGTGSTLTSQANNATYSLTCNEPALESKLVGLCSSVGMNREPNAPIAILIRVQTGKRYYFDSANLAGTKYEGVPEIFDMRDGGYAKLISSENWMPPEFAKCPRAVSQWCEVTVSRDRSKVLKYAFNLIRDAESTMSPLPAQRYSYIGDEYVADWVGSACLVALNNFSLLDSGTERQWGATLSWIENLKNQNARAMLESKVATTTDKKQKAIYAGVLNRLK